MADYEGQDFACPTDIPTSETLAGGIYTVRVAEVKPEVNDRTGKLCINVQYRILDHDMANAPIYDRMFVGTDADPLARDPNTWKEARGGGRAFQRLLAAAGVANSGSVKTNCQALADRQLLIRLVETEGKDANAGKVFNNVRAHWPLGERELMREEPKSAKAQAPAYVAPADAPMPAGGAQMGSSRSFD